MKFLITSAAIAAALSPQVVIADSNVPGTTASRAPFSSSFHQPTPPMIHPEFKASWNQHKWNANVSHIASGYLYMSPANKKARLDLAYDGTLGSSLFDYANVTDEGVLNIQWTLSPAIASTAQFFVGHVQPFLPLLSPNLLIASSAVYAGEQVDNYNGVVTAWNILYQNVLPVTVLLNADNTFCGFDYWNPNERTYATTRFFNIVTGAIGADVFDFPTPT